MERVTRSNEFWRTACPKRGAVVTRFGHDFRAQTATAALGSFGRKVEETRGRKVPTEHHAPVRFATLAEAQAFVDELDEFGAVAVAVCHSHTCGCEE